MSLCWQNSGWECLHLFIGNAYIPGVINIPQTAVCFLALPLLLVLLALPYRTSTPAITDEVNCQSHLTLIKDMLFFFWSWDGEIHTELECANFVSGWMSVNWEFKCLRWLEKKKRKR